MTDLSDGDTFPIWVVYDHPTDYPDHFVARAHRVGVDGQRPTSKLIAAPTLESIRTSMVNLGLTCVQRNEEDDPVIVECWL